MTTTGLYKCLIRQRLVKLTPEEKVRQTLIRKLVLDLGYPRGLISVEKQVGKRRFDLVCFSKQMEPLLLVECKAGSRLHSSHASQLFGYNEKVMAPFFALVNEKEVQFYFQKEGRLERVSFIPRYVELSGGC